jgi:hypothetical protein
MFMTADNNDYTNIDDDVYCGYDDDDDRYDDPV